jgi:CRP-like cAMP-binding protein
VVYREGTDSEYVYIVESGEFQLEKSHVELVSKSINYEKYIGGEKERRQKQAKLDSELNIQDGINPIIIDISPQKKTKRDTIKLAFMAKGNIFGEDDAVLGRKHFGTVKCISGEGVLHCMKTYEFMRKF